MVFRDLPKAMGNKNGDAPSFEVGASDGVNPAAAALAPQADLTSGSGNGTVIRVTFHVWTRYFSTTGSHLFWRQGPVVSRNFDCFLVIGRLPRDWP